MLRRSSHVTARSGHERPSPTARPCPEMGLATFHILSCNVESRTVIMINSSTFPVRNKSAPLAEMWKVGLAPPLAALLLGLKGHIHQPAQRLGEVRHIGLTPPPFINPPHPRGRSDDVKPLDVVIQLGRHPLTRRLPTPISKELRAEVERELGRGTGIQKVAKLTGLMPKTVSQINREMLEKMEKMGVDRFHGWEKE